MNFSPLAVGRAQQLIGQEIRPHAECIHVQAADISKGMRDDKPGPRSWIMPLGRPERLVIERRDEALGVELLFMDETGHRLGQSLVRSKKLQFDIHPDFSSA